MATSMMDLFRIIIMVQIFYAFAITSVAYAIPDDARHYVSGFTDVGNTVDLETVTGEFTSSLESQKNIPIIELGALVFYSGNILIDLMVNFATAIPQMLALLVNGITILIPVDQGIINIVQISATAMISIMYIVGLIQLLTGIRSGRVV